ncbi:hypothetical protein ACFL07_02790 [Pseudomonadota bacterium]|jgi:hypothetical protein
MFRLLLILLLWPLTGTSGTFEIQDPAAEIYQEQQNPQEQQQPEEEQIVVEDIFCAVDEAEGKCWCIHRETHQVVTVIEEECVVRAAKTTTPKQP